MCSSISSVCRSGCSHLRSLKTKATRGLVLAAFAGLSNASFGEALVPPAELHITARPAGNCCFDFDIWQVWGAPGNVKTITANIMFPPGAVISSATNGWVGPAPVVSGTTITWTLPGTGLTPQTPPGVPQYTVRICFSNLPTMPAIVQFQGFDAAGNTADLLRRDADLIGNPCSQLPPCPRDCPQQSRVQICYDGGRADSWGAPDDPATPRPALLSYLTGIFGTRVKGYDNANVNHAFGGTFQNLPCGIVSARLDIRLRAECDIPGNDSINLMFNGTNFAWGSSIAALNGGTWNCPTETTISLNLASLPGGFNMLPLLNANRFLDIYIQDDTSVDWAKLTVQVCPCEQGTYRFYQSGIADNFAAFPVDPLPAPQPRLVAVRNLPPFLYKPYDNCTIDRGVGHTFSGLPAGIVSAGFNTRMRACGGGSNNDSYFFELLNDGAPIIPYSGANFYRGFNLAATWNPFTTATFPHNLGATNHSYNGGCSTLLGNMADRRFDFYVQDDTGVDFTSLRVYACPRIKRFFGTPVAVLGTIDPVFDPVGRRLPIRNLGHSGEDGVSFDVHGAEGYVIDFSEEGAGLESSGSGGVFVATGDLDGDGAAERLSGLAITNENGTRTFRPAFFDIFIEEPLWTIRNSASGDSRTFTLPPDSAIECRGRAKEDVYVWKLSKDDRRRCHHVIKFGEAMVFRVPGLPLFEGDSIEMSNPLHDDAEVEALSMTWTAPAGQTTEVTIDNARPIVSGLLHEACCGDTESVGLDTNPGSATISNVGSAVGGVEVHFDQAETYHASLTFGCAENDEAACAAGDVAVRFVGSQGGETGTDIVNSQVRFRPAFFDIFCDLAPTGTHDVLVKVEQQGDVVAMMVLPGNAVSLTAEGVAALSGCGKQPAFIDDWRTSCIWWEYDRPVFFSIVPGTPPVRGDTIRIIANSPAREYDFTERAVWTSSNTREMTLADQQVVRFGSTSCSRCPADYNQDGGIDGGDVEAFYADWEAGNACGDVNSDGGIDGGDVEAFFAAWEQGSCD